MKTSHRFLVILTAMAFSFVPALVRAQDVPPPPPPPADDQADQSDQGASFQTFYDQLGDQGNWVQTDDYGYVFQPTVSDPNWAPYSDGHWVYSDQGWVWVSDEPWGWATYHYGRWINIDGTGWVWVPGYRWAPAWVSWRYGGGYCGWAPLPPETFIGAEFGGGGAWSTFHFGGDVDVNFGIGPGYYNFVRVGDFGDSNYHGHYLDRSRNYTVINNTTNITNINITRNGAATSGAAGNFRGVSVGGPPINEINAHSNMRVQTVQLAAASQPGRSTLQGNTLAVYAPRVNAATVHQARPAQVSQTLAHPTFNRGASITRPLQVTRTVQAVTPSPAAVQAAQAAQLHAPAKARIATEKTVPRTTLSQPLTSLAPVAPVHRTTTAAPATANTFNNAKPSGTGVEHPAASAPFTGEPVNHTANSPSAQTYKPQTEEKPAETYHPQTEVKPVPAYHPQAEEKPAQTYHPQTEEKPVPAYHPQVEEKPAETYHPQTEERPVPAYHPQAEEKPAETYHPANNPPAPSYHPQAAPAPAPAPASHPAPAASGGNKPADKSGDNNKQNQ